MQGRKQLLNGEDKQHISRRRHRATVSAAIQPRYESDWDAVVEGKGAFARQSTGLRRLVWRGWALPVILGIAIQQLGIVKYALCIGPPSWLEWGSKDYYDKPWEVTADLFGGVQSREASRSDKADVFHYLWLRKQVGPFDWRTID